MQSAVAEQIKELVATSEVVVDYDKVVFVNNENVLLLRPLKC